MAATTLSATPSTAACPARFFGFQGRTKPIVSSVGVFLMFIVSQPQHVCFLFIFVDSFGVSGYLILPENTKGALTLLSPH